MEQMKNNSMKGDVGMSWEKVRLEDICEINMGKTPSRSNATYWNGDLPWVSIADLKGDIFIRKTKECITKKSVVESGIKVVPENTLLYSFKLSIGKVAITASEIYTNEAIVALPIKNKEILDLKYLYWAVQMIELEGIGDKAVMGLTLNKEKLKNLVIPLPPLPIQKRIAEILDAADALRRKDQELL
jgi:type I restriction enzyme S subunit